MPSPSEKWEELLKQGFFAAGQKRYGEAFRDLALALEVAQGMQGLDIRVCLSCNAMSIVKQMSGDKAGAKAFHRDAIAAWNQGPLKLDVEKSKVVEILSDTIGDYMGEEAVKMRVRFRDFRAGDYNGFPLLVPWQDLRPQYGGGPTQAGGSKNWLLVPVILLLLVGMGALGWKLTHPSPQPAHSTPAKKS